MVAGQTPSAKESQSVASRPRSIVIGTAGHIDHGKTALIRALTGVDTDRLPEEKRRGITIDLGFAALETRDAEGSLLRLSFIDVPGHHLFVRNMLAGVGGIDGVMLVVAADEGVMPQTEEHLAICSMLGIRNGLTVITKTDLASADQVETTCRSVERFLRGTFLAVEAAPIIPVSARTGTGLDELRRELAELRKRLPARSQDALTRLPIDRSFVVKGFGTVVTGTFVGGTIRLSQTLTIEPGNRSVRVRGIQIHGHPEDTAYAGSRVALNLAGIDASEVRRGQTLIQPSAVAAVDTFDVEATLLPGVAELKHRAGVHLYAYASETVATVSLYEGYQPVKPGETRLMRMRLDRPVVLLPGDRFVLRQSSPAMTIGGGRILDTRPLSNLRKAACLNWLLDLKDAPLEQQFVLRIARRGTAGLSLNALSAETGLTIEAIVRITERAEHHQSVVRLSNNLLMTREALDMTARLVISELQSRTQNAAVPGLKRAELKTHTKLSAEVFDFILEKLYRERKLDIRGDLVCSSDKADEVTGRDRGLLAAIAADFEAAGLACPAPEDVAKKLAIDHREMRRLITQLLHDKTLVKLGNNDLFVHHDALAKLKGQISSLRGKMLDIASFKQLTGLSRKYAIPLLEHLDRERITRKQDEHSRLVL